ncbi:hypothetical protein H5P36_24585 [Bacillus sp. APMAM]|nr:hypothetical protein [Bacillus sp. APMAM]NEZ01661.1 hypothetical protein [Heyndrickxia shackletonii]RTZ53241.1 hypothetical protein EKO25_24370 [Bacillus sp. SAJ1]
MQRTPKTPFERNSRRSQIIFFELFGWGCLQIGTELSRLFLPDKRVVLSFGRYDAGYCDKPSILLSMAFLIPHSFEEKRLAHRRTVYEPANR